MQKVLKVIHTWICWAGQRRSCSTSRCLGGGVTGAERAVTVVRCHQTGSQCLNLGRSALRNLARKSELIACKAAWKECCLLSLAISNAWWIFQCGISGLGRALRIRTVLWQGDQGQWGGARWCRREHDGPCPWLSRSGQCSKASTDQESQASRECLLTVPRHGKVFPCLTSPPCTCFHWQWTWKSLAVLAAAAFYI